MPAKNELRERIGKAINKPCYKRQKGTCSKPNCGECRADKILSVVRERVEEMRCSNVAMGFGNATVKTWVVSKSDLLRELGEGER